MTAETLIIKLLSMPRDAQVRIAFAEKDDIAITDVSCDHWEGPLAPIYLELAREPKSAFEPSDNDVLTALTDKSKWHEGVTAFEAEHGFSDLEAVALEMPV